MTEKQRAELHNINSDLSAVLGRVKKLEADIKGELNPITEALRGYEAVPDGTTGTIFPRTDAEFASLEYDIALAKAAANRIAGTPYLSSGIDADKVEAEARKLIEELKAGWD